VLVLGLFLRRSNAPAEPGIEQGQQAVSVH